MDTNKKSNYILLNTVYKGDNFGSSLQAYALKTFLQETFHVNCIVVNRQEQGITLVTEKLSRKAMNFLKSFLSPKLFVETWTSHLGKNRGTDRYSETIRKNFQVFTDTHILPVSYTRQELKKLSRASNCIGCVTGSDQIWNPTGIRMNKDNFLTFSPKDKNCAYAASVGVETVPYYNDCSFKRLLKNMKYISVREETAQELLEREFHVQATVCIDPVVLVGKKFWEERLVPISIKTSFIFCYFLNKPSYKAVAKLREYIAEGKKVYVVSRKNFENYNIKCIQNISPMEFLSYIYHADTILTDSFHGTVFSVLFNREFYVFERDYQNSIPQPSRITGFLTRLGIADRYVDSYVESSNFPAEKLDYSKINPIIDQMQETAICFLNEAIPNESYKH